MKRKNDLRIGKKEEPLHEVNATTSRDTAEKISTRGALLIREDH